MIAAAYRIFMNDQMQWTLEATCSDCSCQTTAPLHMGVAVHCVRCAARILVEPLEQCEHP
jgi:ribosomal protein S27E